MHRLAKPFALAAALLTGACVLPGPGHTPYGRVATIYVKGDNSTGIRGELLAASDTIWLSVGGMVVGRDRRDLLQVNVQRHRAGGKRSYAYLAAGGAGTGLGMAAACASYESSEGSGDAAACILLVPFFTALWLGAGSIFAFTNYMSATKSYDPKDLRLPGFSRFPQGLPDTVRALRYIPSSAPRP